MFKIARDEQNNRLTYMKITGGSLKVRQKLTNKGEQEWEEKSTRSVCIPASNMKPCLKYRQA